MYEERPSRLCDAVLWSHAQPRTADPAEQGRVLPDGCMDLLLWNGELVTAGPDTRAQLVPRRPGDRITGLRFAPGVGPLFFGVPASELRDQRVPLAALWTEREVRQLTERLAAAPDRGGALEAFAARRLRAAEAAPGAGTAYADPVRRAVPAGLLGGLGVAEVAAAVGLSERQLHRRCLTAFGYGPKTLARVLRMRRALRLAEEGLPPAQVAHAAGYADQAHLSREVRALAGAPLTRLVRRQG